MYTTYNKAVAAAKSELRSNTGVNRATYLVEHRSTQCCCGETAAVEVTMFRTTRKRDKFDLRTGDMLDSMVVGYCEHCGE